MKKVFIIFFTSLIVSSCAKEKNNDKAGIFKGPETSFFHGKAWTWIELDNTGKPERVAISVNEDALQTVTAGSGKASEDHQHDDNIVLLFHPKADATLFRHVWINWNPDGHPPVGIYDKPHFDFHYYMVSPEERETFVDTSKLTAGLSPAYLPANYTGGDPVPMMGKHYVDLTSPELNGQPFTQTFIYGSYDARLAFWEPMITLEFLKNTTHFERDIPQPVRFQKSGYYPTKLRIIKDNGVTNIILEGFVYRQAS
jgi:hypothetical protein